MALTKITSDGITDGTIVSADINASAAIDGSKISPNFGSQTIQTTGKLVITNNTSTTPEIEFDGNGPNFIRFTDDQGAAGSLDLVFRSTPNTLAVEKSSDQTVLFSVDNDDGQVIVTNNLDVGAGLDVTGNITATGTVDGVDIATRDTLFGGLTSSSGVLTNGVTATTQSAGDNSTKVATTAYTDTAISNLVDSSPSALNTLNELAAALGDDASFSTTVTNSIATKLPLAGGTLTGNVTHNDNVRAIFGTGSDLQLLHDGSNSFITESGTGNLVLSTTAGSIRIEKNTGEPMIHANVDGAVELYYDNSKKFETASHGVTFFGTSFHGDNIVSAFGASSDLQIFHNGNHSKIADTGTGSLILSGSTVEINNAADSENMIKAVENGAVELYHDNTKRIETTSYGARVFGNLENHDNFISVKDAGKFTAGNSDDLQIYHQGTVSRIQDVGVGGLEITSDGTGVDINKGLSEYMARFITDGAVELYHNNSKKFETTANGGEITGRLDITGGYLSVDDNYAVLMGTDGDAQLYHSGTHQYLLNTTGNIYLMPKAGEIGVTVIPDGAVELYHDNIKTFETISGGAKLQGGEGLAAHLYMFADEGDDNADKWVFRADASSSQLKLRNYAGGSWEESIIANGNGAVELYHNNSKKLETTSGGATITGTCTATSFSGDGSNLTGVSSTTINSNSDNRVITGSGTANTLNAESTFIHDPVNCDTQIIHNSNNVADLLVQNTGTGTAAVARLTLHAGSNANSGCQLGLIVGSHSWYLETPKNAGNLNFMKGSQKFRMGDDGDFTISDGDLVIATAGHGIDFSAAGNAGGMTNELLDDYEEGNFTIVAGSGSSVTFNSSNNYASYTKIGRQVTIAGQLRINSGTGNVRIALPFTAASSTEDEDMNFAASVLGYDYNAQNSSGCDGLFIAIDHGLSYARFLEHRDNNPWTSLDGDPGAYLRFTLSYFVA